MKNRIVKFSQFGGPEVLKIILEDRKCPRDDEVRVKIKALGLNQAEVMLREGRYVEQPSLPCRLGIEASGIVEAVGKNVDCIDIGDQVCCLPFLSWDKYDSWTNQSIQKYGTYGETAIVPAWTITKKLLSQSFEDSAASWCQYLTAWGGLVNNVNLKKCKNCVITGASSSAALGAMQIVKTFGVKVIGISRSLKKEPQLLKLGYDQILSLDDPEIEKKLLLSTENVGFDVAYDCIGGEHFSKLINCVKPRGIIVNYGNLNLNHAEVFTLPLLSKRILIKFHSIFDTTRNNIERRKGVSWINNKLEAGVLKPIIAKIFKLDEIVEAHRYLDKGGHLGKTIVIP